MRFDGALHLGIERRPTDLHARRRAEPVEEPWRVFTSPIRDRLIEMKRRPELAKLRPLGERLEMVDRFAGFDLDDPLEPVAPVLRHQHEVRIGCGWAGADGRVLLNPWVDSCFVLAAPLGLEETD